MRSYAMATVGEKGLPSPFTTGRFQQRLDQFEDFIRVVTFRDAEATAEERRQMITENVRYDHFCAQIRIMFGGEVKNQDLKALYRKITTNPDAKVDWSELFGYFQSGNDEDEITVGEEVSVFTVAKRHRVGEAAGDRKRRDTVQCMVYSPAIESYVTVSQKGALSIWTGKLRLHSCTDINESAWATGCDYLPTIRRVVCCTERTIVFWDNRAKSKNQSIYTIKPLEHSPQCIAYVPLGVTGSEDTVLFGDDQGYVNVLTVSAKDLTIKNAKGAENYTSGTLVIEPANLSHPIARRKLHEDWVLKIKYFPELRCFASCSPSSGQSFVLEEVQRIFENTGEIRGVSVPKGVNAFEYCVRANIIATGGVDKIIRVWHPHIFSRPTGKLLGHLFTIVDICCNERDQHIISLSTARVMRVWDIHTLTSLQIFTDNEERPGEKRIYSMLFDNKHEKLLTGSSVIDAWPLTRSVQDMMQVPHTHDRPISQVLYNKDLNQVITLCIESVIKVWEMDSGRLLYQIPDPHGVGVEVTAVAVDKSGYRLVSGASDGSLKVWDFGSGQEIKHLPGSVTEDDLSITGLGYFVIQESRAIIASGWNNKIKLIIDPNETNDLAVVREFVDVYYWLQNNDLSTPDDTFNRNRALPGIGESLSRSSLFRKDYILTSHEVCALDVHLPNILLTGCGNGNVVLWDIEKGLVDKILELSADAVEETDQSMSEDMLNPRSDHSISCIRILVHKVRKLDPAYIRQLTKKMPNIAEDEETSTSPGHISHMTSATSQRSKPQPEHEPEKENSSVVIVDPLLEVSVVNDPSTQDRSDNGAKSQIKFEESDDQNDMTGQVSGQVSVADSTDPDAKMIVETFDAVIVTAHHDSFIRFWTMEGSLLREVTAMTRRQGSAVTSLCVDKDCNIMVTGDQKGYLTMWEIGQFLADPKSEEPAVLKQIISWRGHLLKIVSLAYVDSLNAVLSASTDGSTRVWWGNKGRFVGFFGQHRPFNFPASEQTSGTPTLPYDITEPPLAPAKNQSARQKIRSNKQFEYPLIFARDKWKPFRRSAYIKQPMHLKREPEDKKFFEALIKPKAYNYHLESTRTGEMTQGAVFRALPVYRVITPKTMSTPQIYPATADDKQFMQASSYVRPGGSPSKGARMIGRFDCDRPTRSTSPVKPGYRAGVRSSSKASSNTSLCSSHHASPRRR